jgi:hypothetical protein
MARAPKPERAAFSANAASFFGHGKAAVVFTFGALNG